MGAQMVNEVASKTSDKAATAPLWQILGSHPSSDRIPLSPYLDFLFA
jgi:hypothetical protein